MQAELWEKEITIRKKDDTIREKEMTIREKEDIIREKEDIIREKEDIFREKEDIIRKKENTIREKEDLIWKSENDIRGHKDVIKEKHEELKKANCKVQQLEEDLTKKDDEIRSLEKLREGANCRMEQLKQDLNKKDDEIESLKAVLIMLEDYVKKNAQYSEELEKKKQILEEEHLAKMKQLLSQQTEIENLRCDKDALTESHKQLKSDNEALTEFQKRLKTYISDTKKKTDTTTKELEKQIKQLEKDLGKEKERHKQDIESKDKLMKKEHDQHQKVLNELKTKHDSLQGDYVKLKNECDRVLQFEPAYNSAVQDLKNQDRTIQTQLSTIKKQQSDINWYRNENESKHQMISSLEVEKETLLLRLSKIPDAQLKYTNPNIADLRDNKRPTKLAVDFSELYDNEWTAAYECIEAEGDDEKTKVLYELLKRSYEFCETLSTSHAEAIRKSFTTLNYTKKLHKQNTDVKSSNMLSGRQDRTDEVHELAKGNDDMNQTVQNYRQSSFKNTARSRPQNGKQYKKKEVPDDTKVLLIGEGDCAKKRNDVTDVTISELIFNFDDFSTEQKKTILDLRKLCEEKQANDVVQVGSKLIATETQIENGEIMEFISKCIDICWSMCRHTPPVYINYSKSEEGLPFDKQKYRPYTKSGNIVHFVVWPVLYLHEGGPQLSKGVAQGKD